MTSYERVVTSLRHREPDRVPFDLGGSMVTGININALNRLRPALGLSGLGQVKDRVTQMAHTGADVEAILGTDVTNVGPFSPACAGLARDVGHEEGHDRLIDEFGIGWQMPLAGGHYYDLYHSPLATAETPADVEKYPWPDPLDAARYADLKQRVDHAVVTEEKGVVIGRMSSGMWEHAMWMTGYEKFFMDMVLNRPLVEAIMEKILEIKMAYWGRVLELVDEHVLVISCADDLGSQNGLLVSLDLYKEMIWPYHKRLFEFIKSKAKTEVYIFFHNDGAIYETLPLLIAAGIDIINPWQVNCAGMGDTKKFKREFGKDLTVWGGTCSAPTLEFGTPAEVRDETRRHVDALAPGGGFIAAPIHVIQGGVPPENIIAWWETIRE
jgi:uroporphyrinogen decarboxylase